MRRSAGPSNASFRSSRCRLPNAGSGLHTARKLRALTRRSGLTGRARQPADGRYRSGYSERRRSGGTAPTGLPAGITRRASAGFGQPGLSGRARPGGSGSGTPGRHPCGRPRSRTTGRGAGGRPLARTAARHRVRRCARTGAQRGAYQRTAPRSRTPCSTGTSHPSEGSAARRVASRLTSNPAAPAGVSRQPMRQSRAAPDRPKPRLGVPM